MIAPMIRWTRRRLTLRPALLATLAAALLLARAIAPSATEAPPGLIPICSGGEIIYVALDHDSDDNGGNRPTGDTERQICPWLGLFAAAAWSPPSLHVERSAAPTLTPPARLVAATPGVRAAYLSRAPPQLV